MPVRKFRSVAEMKAPVWPARGDPGLFRAIARVWGFGVRTNPVRYPPGVYKHASIEGLNALTEAWDRDNFRAFRQRRAKEASLTVPDESGPR